MVAHKKEIMDIQAKPKQLFSLIKMIPNKEPLICQMMTYVHCQAYSENHKHLVDKSC